MPNEIYLTLRELTKIALGTPQLTKVNLSILHVLIDVLLKKLDCSEEEVSINGFDARCLEEIMFTTKSCPLHVNDERIELISSKITRLEDLERRVSSIDAKLEQHLQQIYACIKSEEIRNKISVFDLSSKVCEDLCTLCDPNNTIACSLLGNNDFHKKLLRRLSLPMVKRIFIYESKINEFAQELSDFIKRTKEHIENIKLIDGCRLEVNILKEDVKEHDFRYIATQEEVQDLLDTKLDKMHIPPLKKYIRDCIDNIDSRLKIIENRTSCTKAAGVALDVRCVACGVKTVCADRGAEPIGILADFKPCCLHVTSHGMTDETNQSRFCSCEKPGGESHIVSLAERQQMLKPKRVDPKLKQRNKTGCNLFSLNSKELIGTNGNIYRAG